MKLRKILAISSMTASFLVVSISAFAETDNISEDILVENMEEYTSAIDNLNGDLSVEEGGEEYVLTPEDEELVKQKDSMLAVGGRASAQVTIPVTVFEQENNYYCGPATVKQVINYINGSSSSQSSYASQLGTTTSGTDMTKIAGVLKSNTGKNYVYAAISSKDTWYSRVMNGVNNRMPAILDINTNSVSSIPYNSSGHYVNISGFDAISDRVRITDPWTLGLGNRWYSANDMYTANKNHSRAAMIY